MDRRILNKLGLWALLSIPALVILYRYWIGESGTADLLQPTGEWSARLIIVALSLTPLGLVLPGNAAVRWLLRHRRSFGVAAFGYTLLHLVFYVLDMETVANMLAELGAPAIWTGWLALLCLLPPALASNNASMRALKAGWKRLQRLVYPAAILTLAHWFLVHDGQAAAIAHFAPLAALQALRLARSFHLVPLKRKTT